MASWPATLPTYPLIEGGQETYGNNIIRTQTDVGPAKIRRRMTNAPSRFVMNFILSSTQMGYFDTFYHTTVSDGSVSFTMNNPRTGTCSTLRFFDVPVAVPLGNGYHRLTFTVEVLS